MEEWVRALDVGRLPMATGSAVTAVQCNGGLNNKNKRANELIEDTLGPGTNPNAPRGIHVGAGQRGACIELNSI
jgi:hypothetical protein